MEGLAQRAGISSNYLYNIEKNRRKPTIKFLERVLKALNARLEVVAYD